MNLSVAGGCVLSSGSGHSGGCSNVSVQMTMLPMAGLHRTVARVSLCARENSTESKSAIRMHHVETPAHPIADIRTGTEDAIAIHLTGRNHGAGTTSSIHWDAARTPIGAAASAYVT